MSLFAFDANRIVDDHGGNSKRSAIRAPKAVAASGLAVSNWTISPPISGFQFCRATEGDQLAFAEDGEAIAVLGLFHQVGGHQHGDTLLIAEDAQIIPQVDARAGVDEAGGGLVEQQHQRANESALASSTRRFWPPESFDHVVLAIGEANAVENLFRTSFS